MRVHVIAHGHELRPTSVLAVRAEQQVVHMVRRLDNFDLIAEDAAAVLEVVVALQRGTVHVRLDLLIYSAGVFIQTKRLTSLQHVQIVKLVVTLDDGLVHAVVE